MAFKVQLGINIFRNSKSQYHQVTVLNKPKALQGSDPTRDAYTASPTIIESSCLGEQTWDWGKRNSDIFLLGTARWKGKEMKWKITMGQHVLWSDVMLFCVFLSMLACFPSFSFSFFFLQDISEADSSTLTYKIWKLTYMYMWDPGWWQGPRLGHYAHRKISLGEL